MWSPYIGKENFRQGQRPGGGRCVGGTAKEARVAGTEWVGGQGLHHQVYHCVHRPGIGLELDAKQVPLCLCSTCL